MHPVRANELYACRTVGKPWACVTVRREKDALIITGPIGVLKVDAILVPLPARLSVISEDGETIKPSRGRVFWISTESFDPYHLVTEMEP